MAQTDSNTRELTQRLADADIPCRVVHNTGDGYAVIPSDAPNSYSALQDSDPRAFGPYAAHHLSLRECESFVAGLRIGYRKTRQDRADVLASLGRAETAAGELERALARLMDADAAYRVALAPNSPHRFALQDALHAARADALALLHSRGVTLDSERTGE